MKVNKDTSFAILGLGKFGMSMARELSREDYDLLCCDRSELLVKEAAAFTENVVQADASDAHVLKKLGIGNFDVVLICFSNIFEEEVLSIMICKEEKVPFIVAKATGFRQKEVLENIGADLVILPEIEMGQRLVHRLLSNDPMEYIYQSEYFEILEISPQEEWIGKRVDSLQLRQKHGMNILVIIRDNVPIRIISPETKFRQSDRLVVMWTQH